MWIYDGRRGRRIRKLYNTELHNLYSSTNIIRVIKSSRVNLAENRREMYMTGSYFKHTSQYNKLVCETEQYH
jgi:hypothetical protein